MSHVCFGYGRHPKQSGVSIRRMPVANPNQVVPTGFSGKPPVGPAMPLTEIPISALNIFRAPRAISNTVSALTAPCVLSVSHETPSKLTLASLAYATTPPGKYSDEPETFVIRSETSPPVQDSAAASVKPRERMYSRNISSSMIVIEVSSKVVKLYFGYNSPMANWTGKTLGKVKIGEFIARGGMAEVYLGEHATLDRKVAVKIMRDHVEAEPENHTRFEREARVVASLRHPNIIQVFDYELMDGQPCLVMEYVPGASLGNYLKALHKRGEKLPLEMVGRILSAIASAIDYAHSQNMIHRDIKPANVLLRSASGPVDIENPLPEDVEPVLTDFGLVRLLDASVHTSTGNSLRHARLHESRTGAR